MLLITITVILAAVIGSFVLNLGGSLQQGAPQASFDFEYNTVGPNVAVTHTTGDTIDEGSVEIVNSAGGSTDWPVPISAGNMGVHDYSSSGDMVHVTWESENGENSATLSQSTAT